MTCEQKIWPGGQRITKAEEKNDFNHECKVYAEIFFSVSEDFDILMVLVEKSRCQQSQLESTSGDNEYLYKIS